MRHYIYANARWLKFVGGFKNLAGDTALLQRQCQGEPADSAADNKNFWFLISHSRKVSAMWV